MPRATRRRCRRIVTVVGGVRTRHRLMLPAMTVAAVLMANYAEAALDPLQFTPLGSLNVGNGAAITINTDTLAISGAASFTGITQAQTGGPDIAVFCFTSIAVPTTANVTITGSRPLALLSTGTATIDGTLSVSAGAAQQSPGPGASPSENGPTSGGGFGGRGGEVGQGPSQVPGGTAYSKLWQTLQSGSDAGDISDNTPGGRGGGGLEIDAVQNLTLRGTVSADGGDGQVSSNVSTGGGSGGGLILHAGQTLDIAQATLSAGGGNGPNSNFGSGGGGGGGAILLNNVASDFNPDSIGSIATLAHGNVSGGIGGTDLAPATAGAGKAGVITLVPQSTVLSSAKTYSGPIVAQAGSATQTTPTVMVQIGKLSITSSGALTQGVDQLIFPGSSLQVAGSYSLAGFAQTLGSLQGSGSVDLRNGSRLTLNVPTGTDTFAGSFLQTSTSPGGGGSLTKIGAGTVALTGSAAYTGPTTVLQGTLTLAPGTALANSPITVGGGATAATLRFTAGTANTRQLIALTLGDKGTAVVAPATTTATHSLLVAASLTFAGGKLDLGNNALIVRNASLGAIASQIALGYAGGTWNGASGILSSSVAGSAVTTALGYGIKVGTFDGQPATANDVVVKYTLAGDATLDGTVNFDDLVPLAQNYNGSNKVWSDGDSNYDTVVNFDDLVVLAQNYGQNVLTETQSTLVGGAFASDFALAQSLVPEPGALGVLAAIVGLIRRRRSLCISGSGCSDLG